MTVLKRSVFCFAILMAVNSFASSGGVLAADQLKLSLNGQGACAALNVGAKDIAGAKPESRSGFYVVEYPGKETVVLTGSLKKRFGKLIQDAGSEPAQLKLHAEYRQCDGYIAVNGVIEDLSGKDRAIDLVYELPVSGAGWQWWKDYATRLEVTGCMTNIAYPMACVSSEKDKAAVVLAVDGKSPCVYSIEYNPKKEVLLIRFNLGLTKDAKKKLQSRAPFGFLIYTVDPKWGFRAALKKYYDVYADLYQRKAMKDGLQVEALVAEERVLNPKWNPAYFAYSRTCRMQACETDLRKSLGMDDYLYVLPGQLELKYLPSLPTGYDDAMSVYKQWLEGPDRMNVKESLMSANVEIKPLIEAASLRNSEGKYELNLRDTEWGHKSITFTLNPDPDLFCDQKGKRTFTDVMMANIAEEIKLYPTYAGVFSDSFHGWGGRKNYRREHFRYADFPFTHDEKGRIYIYNMLSHLEWVNGLKERFGKDGRLVMGNGLRPESQQSFVTMNLDVLMVEVRDLSSVRWDRSMAYQKPFHLSWMGDKSPEGMETCLKLCALNGLLPNRMGAFDQMPEDKNLIPTRMSTEIQQGLIENSYCARDNDLIDKYVPVILEHSRLGWEPVPYASTSDPEIQIERFGPKDGKVSLAIYNTGKAAKQIAVDLDTKALGINQVTAAKLLFADQPVKSVERLDMNLAAGGLVVLQIEFK
jgi:hypothetical protein